MDGTALLDESRRAAKAVGLRYASDEQPGFGRHRAGKGFRYADPNGKTVRDKETLKRIRALVIPPAWTDVWICPHEDGHVQVTARDDKGRKQYKYHPDFRAARETGKYDHLLDFAAVLPQIRETVAKHMAQRGPGRDLGRERVLATGESDVVFLTWHWQSAWWKTFGRGELLLIAVERDGEVIALAPLFTEAGMIYFVGSGGSDYLNFIGDILYFLVNPRLRSST